LGYTLESIALKDLKWECLYDESEKKVKKYLTEQNPALEFLKGNPSLYREYNERKKHLFNDAIHCEKKFLDLIKNCEKSFDNRRKIVCFQDNIICDGFHRASYLLHTLGENHKIEILKVYILGLS
jgi:hypothetical protein